MKLSDVLPEATRLAREKQEYWEAELPRRHPDYPLVRPDGDDGPPPPQEKQLAELMKRLPGPLVYQLALLVYLGRGYFPATDLAAGLDQVKSMFPRPALAVAYMLDNIALAESWELGLAELHRAGLDVDTLLLKPDKVRK